jgi:hypothetical protein
VHLSVNGDEEVLVVEVTIGGGNNLTGLKIGTVISVVELDSNILDIWAWDVKLKVLKISTIEVNLWDSDVLDEVEDVWGDYVLSLVDTFLGNRDGDTWSLGGFDSSRSKSCKSYEFS